VKIKLALTAVVILALVWTPLTGQTPTEKKELPLTMEEAIVKALKNNLSLAVQIYNPAIAEETISQAKEYFYPQLQVGAQSQHTESASYWFLQGSTSVLDKMSDYSIALAQQIPTGGSLSLSFAGYKDDTTQAFQLINPRYGSTLRFDFTQPLLKNFGFKVSRQQIIIAQNNRDISNSQLESAVMDTIYTVEEAYWNLVYSIEDYKVREQSLQLARDLLDKNKKEVEVGQLAPIEILNAKATVALREADMLAAKAAILRGQDVLKTVINLPAEGEAKAANIIPADKPGFVKKEVSLEKSLQEALDRRPNLRAARKDIDNKALDFSVAKNQTLPSLDFKASYWSPGISGDKLIYLDDNPFLGVVIRKEPGSPGQATRDAFKLRYDNWTVGVTLSIPLSTLLSRAEYARTKLELEQTQTQFKSLEQQITLEVSDAVRNIEINAQRYEAYKLARELTEQQLAAEERKLSVGLSTNFFVLDAQDKLASARSLELKSLVEYNLSLIQLERATGTALTTRNISVSQFEKR
jgi:outer membrane protein TolC